MKTIYTACLLLATLGFSSCSKEDKPGFTPELGFEKQFTPPADAPAEVKEMYDHYGVWMRMDFNNWKEVTNGVLETDPNNRWGAEKIEDAYRASATVYAQTFLSQVSGKFAKKFFPLELFFVKSYGGSFWMYDIKTIGRSRLIVCWPNQMYGALPVTDPANHYYQDTVLARSIWANLGPLIAARIETPINDFVLAGKAYDNGEAQDKIWNQFNLDKDTAARIAAMEELARNGGFITSGGAGSFVSDFSQWMTLLVTESYDNIQAQYLENSPARAKKYEIIIRYFKEYDWDIQAMGNEYRRRAGN